MTKLIGIMVCLTVLSGCLGTQNADLIWYGGETSLMCSMQVNPAVRVYVTDINRNPLSGAIAELKDLASNETIGMTSESPMGDVMVGAYGQTGTFLLRVYLSGYAPHEETVSVGMGGCGVETQERFVKLSIEGTPVGD